MSAGTREEQPAEPAGATDRWLRLLGAVSCLALFALLVLICVDVVGRYFFSAPIRGALEIADMLMCGTIFAVLPLVCWRQSHVTIDLLDRLTPPRVAAVQRRLVHLVGAGFLALVAWRMWIYAGKIAEYGDQTLFLKIPLYWPNYFIAVLAALAALVLLVLAARGRTPEA